MNENVKVFIIATLVIIFMLILPSLIESAKLLSPESGFADEKAVEEILDDKSNNNSQPIIEESLQEKPQEEVMPADEFDTIIKPDDDD